MKGHQKILVFILVLAFLLFLWNSNRNIPIDKTPEGEGIRYIQPSEFMSMIPTSSATYSNSPEGLSINKKRTLSLYGNCQPDGDYNVCHLYEASYGEAKASAKIQSIFPPSGEKKGSYYLKEAYIEVEADADKFYYQESKSTDWDSFWNNQGKCTKSGCSGTIFNDNRLLLADSDKSTKVGNEYTGCPIFYAWDYDMGGDGSWAWAYGGYGWVGTGNCFNIQVIDCYDDSDCSYEEYCNKAGNWNEWSCIEKECESGEDKCKGFDYYSCENYKFANKGRIEGKCDYGIGQYYRYDETSNSCIEKTILSREKTANDYETTEECEDNIKADYGLIVGIAVLSILILIFIIGLILYLKRRKHGSKK